MRSPLNLLVRPGSVRREILPPDPSLHLPMVAGNWINGYRRDALTTQSSNFNVIAGVGGGTPHLGGASARFEFGSALENAGTYTSTNSAWASSTHMTLGVWIRLLEVDLAGSTIMARGDVNSAFGNRCFWFYLNADRTIRLRYFTGSNSRSLDSTETVKIGRWHHVVWVARPSTTGTSKIYLDGVEVASGSLAGNMNTTARQPAFGMIRQNTSGTTWSTSTRFRGEMAHAFFWRRDLSAVEASKLYVATHPGF